MWKYPTACIGSARITGVKSPYKLRPPKQRQGAKGSDGSINETRARCPLLAGPCLGGVDKKQRQAASLNLSQNLIGQFWYGHTGR